MELQIDIKKPDDGFTSSKVNFYVDGECFELAASHNTVQAMVKAGIVKQTRRSLRNEDGKIEYFDYPEGYDGMGVKYTSPVFHGWTELDAPVFEFDQNTTHWILRKNGTVIESYPKKSFSESEATFNASQIVKEANKDLPRMECKFITLIPVI